MAEVIQLRQRCTHSYRDGWAHLDKHRELGSAKLLPARLIREGNGCDEGPRYRYKAVLKAGMDLKQGAIALNEYFRATHTSSCSHDHDCCGCRFAYVDVKHRRGREFSVTLQIMRNY